MGFGSPWILWALATIVLPIIIHLFYFRRYKKIDFSSIRFLQEVVQQQKKAHRLKNILVLLARILTITFLVLAFALPFLGKNNSQQNASGKIIIYIDNTESMGILSNNRTLLSDAKNAALNILDNLDPNHQVMVLSNDIFNHVKTFNQPKFAKEIIESIELTPYTLSAEEWQASAKNLLDDLHESDIKLIWISDFQANTLPETWDSVFTQVSLIPINFNTKTPNISIDSLCLLNPIVIPNSGNHLVVKIRNQGKDKAQFILSLQIEQEAPFSKEIDIKPNSIITDTIVFYPKRNVSLSGKVSINDANLTFDNSLYFHTDIRTNNEVLLIEDISSSKQVGQVFQNDNYQKLYRQNATSPIEKSDYNLIILNEVKNIPTENIKSLTTYVENGGNLLIIPTENNATEIYQELLDSLNVGQYSEKRTGAHSVTEINNRAPEFSLIFEKEPKNIDLPKVNSYWNISSSYQTPESFLMKLDNGKAFINKFQVNKGIVYLQASSLKNDVNDFSQKYIFAPLIYNFSIVKSDIQPLYYTLGKNEPITSFNISSGENALIKMSNGESEVIPAIIPMGQKLGLKLPKTIQSDGIYEITNNNDLIGKIALNYNRIESEMSFIDFKELSSKYKNPHVQIKNPDTFLHASKNLISNTNTPLWKICVILALIFLLIEITLIRFIKN